MLTAVETVSNERFLNQTVKTTPVLVVENLCGELCAAAK